MARKSVFILQINPEKSNIIWFFKNKCLELHRNIKTRYMKTVNMCQHMRKNPVMLTTTREGDKIIVTGYDDKVIEEGDLLYAHQRDPFERFKVEKIERRDANIPKKSSEQLKGWPKGMWFRAECSSHKVGSEINMKGKQKEVDARIKNFFDRERNSMV